eukprot:m.99162 g.99162  ORF g.99162 m.99162 type:complete len:116 (+) comp37045_c0_seq1:6427-6774(+)
MIMPCVIIITVMLVGKLLMLPYLSVCLQRVESKAHAPCFPKAKDEGWWLVLGDVESGELVALKRVGFVRKTTRINLAFYTPETAGRKIYTLYVMSDSYLGLDQQHDINVEMKPEN